MVKQATENGTAAEPEAGTDLVQVPAGFARLQRQPAINLVDEKTLQLIASQIAPGCSRGEIGHFLELCAHYDLDPFAKEAWCAKGKGDNARLLIMVGRDGLRKIGLRQHLKFNEDVVHADDTYEVEFIDTEADAKTGEWEANGRVPFHRVTHKHKGMGPARGVITGAWCRVRDQERREVGWFEANIGEFKPKDQRKLQYSPWGSQESVMILAAAERQALRQATPLGGLLAEGEDARVIDAQVVDEPSLPQDLSNEEAQELLHAIESAGWTEDEARMQLVAAGAADVASVETGVRSLTRDGTLALVAQITKGNGQADAAETLQDALPVDDGEMGE